jgi:hypothetical protein
MRTHEVKKIYRGGSFGYGDGAESGDPKNDIAAKARIRSRRYTDETI